VGKVVSGARRDPRSLSDSEIQMIQDREVKKPFWREGGLRQSGIREEYIIEFYREKDKRQHNAA
jgi:hypothetical protein